MIFFLRSVLIRIIQIQARIIVWRYSPRVIAITGSVGKTTTKDAIYAIISQTVHTRRSRKSFNSGIGIPLTILGAPTGWRDILKWLRNILKGMWLIVRFWGTYPEWLVLELGISKPGDMQELKKWVQPYVVVVSAFGATPSHVEFFNTPQDVWKEESTIIEALDPQGVLVLNADDPEVMKCQHMLTEGQTLLTYGYDESADVRISDYEYVYHDGSIAGMQFTYKAGEKNYTMRHLGVLGAHLAYGIAAGIAIHNHIFGVIDDLGQHCKDISFPKGRLNIIKGIHNTIILDDTYNSSPSALQSALSTLGDINTSGKKIALLGDMLELGKFSDEAHQKAGAQAARMCDYVVTVGPRAKNIYTTITNLGWDNERIFHAQNSHEAAEYIIPHLSAGDVILVKGSQGVRMEHAVKALMSNPEDAERLLVRQEAAWIGKK